MKGAPILAAAFALLAGCAQPEIPVQPLPPGATPAEIADYAAAQAQHRFGRATGDGDAVRDALRTFRRISAEILSRQDPKLFEAQMVCQRYRIAGATRYPGGMPATFEPRFTGVCDDIGWRYDAATAAIRGDLEAKIAAADHGTIAQAGARRP